ncbi:glycoside hydrolase family 108 protein [Variovorax sp. J22R115]|uniref:glycoside hydrolase family 108 protein n=1 Tax=Variovorax sp. J22R115 TaxID=3053509 RepID=UPI0025791D4B|nr:glycosyl hydrolase 108 family protein [Variovorax sp. J22R115]MDM0047944.1 glycosyl hydrolase 108 family protein [Variovorax sp. J22R115]
MPTASFADSLPFILRWEGGYVNHPADPGGATNRGVTQKVYDAWRQKQGQSAQDVRQLSDAEMRSIYETNYWRPARCDTLERKLDVAHFDTAVNMGVGRAVRFLQAALGCQVDGAFGDGTLRAVQQCNDLAKTLVNYCNEREAFYDRLVVTNPKLAVFRKGWNNRLNALRKEVGLPGYEADVPTDYGDADHIARVPDIGEDPIYDF